MAVREAAVNAVLHGNSYDTNKHVVASFETTSDSLIIRISDQGPGLDPDKIPDPLAPENILSGSGRGIFLIKAFMDEVNFRQLHPGTELTLIKHRTPAQPEPLEPGSLNLRGLNENTTHEHESTHSPGRRRYHSGSQRPYHSR